MLKLRFFTNNFFIPSVNKTFLSYEKQEILPKVPHMKSDLYRSLILLQPNSPNNSKVLKISVLGCPNSGKSSLVNMLTRWDTCAVSGKVNTTRNKQTAILTQNEIQLCFIDLPGVIAKRKGFNFKLEKSLIRDPHVGVFESDLIMCVVDVSHKSSKEELHLELLKALHFFKDKPTILVLNKIDKVRTKMILFDITRRLTDGVVGGRISHRDSYANRYKKSVPTYQELLEEDKFSKLYLKHTSIPLLGENSQNNMKLISSNLSIEASKNKSDCVDPKVPDMCESNKNKLELIQNDINLTNTSEFGNLRNNDVAQDEQDMYESNKNALELIKNNINPINTSEMEDLKNDDDDQKFLNVLFESDPNNSLSKLDIDIDDPILDVLKKQLMMKSATKEEVALRRAAWKEIGNFLERSRETSWRHFDDVFAVSSVTGHGISSLREYLMNRAKPGSWYFHSSLITDQEPESLVRMCILANCLNQLEKEIPYQIKIEINNYEKCEDGSLHIHVILRCKTSRQLMSVLGKRGSNISAIADKSRLTLQKCFQTDVYLKLTAARRGIPGEHLRRMKSVEDFGMLYPGSPKV